MRLCTIRNCHEHTTAFGRYCSKHKNHNRRHGDPIQIGLRKSELKPYLDAVDEIIERNLTNPVWEIAVQRWQVMIDRCHGLVDEYRSGQVSVRFQRFAAYELIRLDESVDEIDVIRLVCAVYLMQGQQPRRFRSDKAFRFQLVRQTLRLTTLNSGTWYDHRSGRVKRVYRDPVPRAVEELASILITTLGVVGVRVIEADRAYHQRVLQERQDFHQALQEIA